MNSAMSSRAPFLTLFTAFTNSISKVGFFSALLAASLVADAQVNQNVSSLNSSLAAIKQISVFGQGRVSVEPDLFKFTISVEEKGKVVTKLNQVIVAKSEKIVKQLVKSGVDLKDIQSMHVQLRPLIEYVNNSRVQDGFVLTRQIKVSVKNIAKFDTLIDNIIRAGATSIDNFHYQVSQPRLSYLNALDLAVVDAQMRAERMAASMDVKIGKVLKVKELNSSRVQTYGVMSMEASRSSDSYVPGVMDIGAEVEVIFQLQ